MTYSIEPKYKEYVEGYDYFVTCKQIGDEYGKKSIKTATKTEIDAAKTALKE